MMKARSMDIKAEGIRAALSTIAELNGGYLNPAHVVEAARDEENILHDEFVWDDEDAAEAYRLAQAGALIRRVKFTVVRPSKDKQSISISTTRAYQSRQSARGSSGGYESLEAIMSDENKREELLQQVLRELKAYRKRYADLAALGEVWNAIDDAADVLASPIAVASAEEGAAA